MAKSVARRRTQIAYGLIFIQIALSAVLLLAHAGIVLNYAFPVMAFVVAGMLWLIQPASYCAFVLWIWFFTPLARRLVDYQSSFHNISPVMLSPLLVTLFTLFSLLRSPTFILRRDMLPMLLILLVITYAFIVGIFTNGPLAAAFEYSNWLLPLTFAIYLLSRGAEYEEVRTRLLSANLTGLLLVSIYGIYQFYRMPPWDAYWISASKFNTAGVGVAEQVRVFSTLNSPGPYAIVLMGSLIFVFVAKGPLRLAAGGVGFAAFALSLVRSAWGGWLLGTAFVLWRAKSKTRLNVLVAGIVIVIVMIPLVTAGPVADKVSQRLSSVQNIQQDSSYQARQKLYDTFAITAISQPIGVGFGQIGLATKLTTGSTANFDSGILQAPLEFGWFGALVFAWAVGALVLRVLNATLRTKNQLAHAGAGLFIASIAQNIFASTFSGVLGFELWLGLGFALGAAPVRQIVTSKASVIEPAKRFA